MTFNLLMLIHGLILLCVSLIFLKASLKCKPIPCKIICSGIAVLCVIVCFFCFKMSI